MFKQLNICKFHYWIYLDILKVNVLDSSSEEILFNIISKLKETHSLLCYIQQFNFIIISFLKSRFYVFICCHPPFQIIFKTIVQPEEDEMGYLGDDEEDNSSEGPEDDLANSDSSHVSVRYN